MEGHNQRIQEDNLLTQIWVKPKGTLAYILQSCPEKYVPVLLCLGGIVRAIDRASMKDAGDTMSTTSVLLSVVIGGGLFGWLTYYIYAWAMSVTGRWVNGHASPSNFRTVIAWALIPSITSLVLLVPEVLIFGDDLFKSEPINTSDFNNTMRIVFGIVEMTLGVWTLVIMVKGVSLIQNFTTGKSILNLILPGLLIIGLIVMAVIISKLFE